MNLRGVLRVEIVAGLDINEIIYLQLFLLSHLKHDFSIQIQNLVMKQFNLQNIQAQQLLQ